MNFLFYFNLMSSLFEIYDPYTFLFKLNFSWFIFLFVWGSVYLKFWLGGGSVLLVIRRMLLVLVLEFKSLYSSNKMKKSSLGLFVVLFFYILLINLLGLVPYTFSASSHFVFSLGLGFPFWVSFMLLGWLENTNSMFVHLIPMGTPLPLIPLMVLIETVSSLIRPWSLSVRLMANMISGHLLMSLLGNCGLMFLLVQVVLFLFEFFVCFIQAYVFSVLLTLYSSEI